DAATITHALGAVSGWNDKSGNNYHLTQATGSKRPITGTEIIHGLNVLHFDGSKVLEAPSALYGIAETDNTLFVVLALDNLLSDQRPIAGAISNGATRYGLLFNVTAGEY